MTHRINGLLPPETDSWPLSDQILINGVEQTDFDEALVNVADTDQILLGPGDFDFTSDEATTADIDYSIIGSGRGVTVLTKTEGDGFTFVNSAVTGEVRNISLRNVGGQSCLIVGGGNTSVFHNVELYGDGDGAGFMYTLNPGLSGGLVQLYDSLITAVGTAVNIAVYTYGGVTRLFSCTVTGNVTVDRGEIEAHDCVIDGALAIATKTVATFYHCRITGAVTDYQWDAGSPAAIIRFLDCIFEDDVTFGDDFTDIEIYGGQIQGNLNVGLNVTTFSIYGTKVNGTTTISTGPDPNPRNGYYVNDEEKVVFLYTFELTDETVIQHLNADMVDDEHLATFLLVGEVRMYPSNIVPAKWLLCYGQALSRSTYADLFEVLCPANEVTFDLTSPGKVFWTGHPFVIGDKVRFTTTGTLPTGITANTNYYLSYADPDWFAISAAWMSGSSIDFSGSPSGVHTCRAFWWGEGDGTTTFNVPNYQGRVPLGRDNMGGTPANSVIDNQADNIGLGAGNDKVALSVAQLAQHSHVQDSHNHTQSSHNHTQNSHNHTQNSHNHTQNAHDHTAQGTNEGGASTSPNGTLPAVPTPSIYKNTATGLVTMNTNHIATQTATNIAQTPTNIAQTATNIAQTAVNIAATATNQNTGSDAEHENMPPYTTINFIIFAGV